jgi:hypothetical protein
MKQYIRSWGRDGFGMPNPYDDLGFPWGETGLACQALTTPVPIHYVSGINREANRRLKRVVAVARKFPKTRFVY